MPLTIFMCGIVFVSTVLPVLTARLRDERRGGAKQELSLQEVIADARLNEEFEEWCRSEFTLDHLWFLADTQCVCCSTGARTHGLTTRLTGTGRGKRRSIRYPKNPGAHWRKSW